MALHVWKRFFAWVTWPTGFGIVIQHSLALHLCFRGSIFRILPVKEKSCFRYAAVVILQHGLPCYYFHVMLPTRIRWIFAAWLCWQFSKFTWVINIYPWFPWYRRHTWSASIKVYEGVHPHPSILIFIPMNILTRMILPRTKFRMEDMMRKHDQPHCYLLKVGVFFSIHSPPVGSDLCSLGASPEAWFYDFYVAGAVKDDVKFDLNKLSRGVFLFWDGERVGWLGWSFQHGKKHRPACSTRINKQFWWH